MTRSRNAALIHIRTYSDRDLDALHAINEAGVPGVNSVARDHLGRLLSEAITALVAEIDGEVAGFVLCLSDGLDYDSLNYRWISARFERFAYVDRIVTCRDFRGRGVGRALYGSAFDTLAGVRDLLLCEVNLAPPNPGSLRFHKALGFESVGERWLPDRSKGVIYLARKL